jgi:glycosyltransferase involved in cell wall biosynthesis
MKNTVTIAIPVYNGEEYLLEALQSITKQTNKIDEVFISDNHSTDGTIDIIKEFKKNHPELTIRLHQNSKNIGVINNFNNCFKMCKTDFLLILGADDRLKPNTVEKQLIEFSKRPDLALVGGLFDIIDQDGKTTYIRPKNGTVVFEKGDILSFMKQTNFYMQHATIMYNMKYTRDIGYYDLFAIAPDERLSVRHLLEHPIAQIREGIIESRIHNRQVTQSERLRFKDKIKHFEANLEMAKYESTPDRQIKLKKLIKEWTASQCLSIGQVIGKNYGKYWSAVKYWNYGIKQSPRILIKKHFWKTILVSTIYR